MIETRKVLDLQINLQPSFLLLPKFGFYSDKTDVVIVDFGSFQVHINIFIINLLLNLLIKPLVLSAAVTRTHLRCCTTLLLLTFRID